MIKWSVRGETRPLKTIVYVILQIVDVFVVALLLKVTSFFLNAFNPRDYFRYLQTLSFLIFSPFPSVSCLFSLQIKASFVLLTFSVPL